VATVRELDTTDLAVAHKVGGVELTDDSHRTDRPSRVDGGQEVTAGTAEVVQRRQ